MKFTRIFLLILLSNNLFGQVNTQDSLALIDILNDNCTLTSCTLGTDWNTANPISTWPGVALSGDGTRVTELNLDAKNLSGSVNNSITVLTDLTILDLKDNQQINSLPDISLLASLQTLNVNDCNLEEILGINSIPGFENLLCQNNRLTFEDFSSDWTSLNIFDYSPQDSVGAPITINAFPGDSVKLSAKIDYGLPNSYEWSLNSNPIDTTLGEYLAADAAVPHLGVYDIAITNSEFDSLTLNHHKIKLQVAETQSDPSGGIFHKDEFVVEYAGTPTASERVAIRTLYNAEVLDSCICNIELWRVDSTQTFEGSGIWLIDPEDKKGLIGMGADIESIDYNYVVENYGSKSSISGNTATSGKTGIKQTSLEQVNGSVSVAIMDTGSDDTHVDLEENYLVYLDDPENCVDLDTSGYNFARGVPFSSETVWWHGTHVAGIIDNISEEAAQIIDIKIFDQQQFYTTLFAAVCGTYYAISKDAKVINMSWGWQGEPSIILGSVIQQAGSECGSVIVTSAGNDSTNNDLVEHYPSGYNEPHMLEVTAIQYTDGQLDSLAFYANWGSNVDLAAPGSYASYVPGDATSTHEGTSMAAAAISATAAKLYAEYPQASNLQVIDAIMSSTVSEASINNLIPNNAFFDPATMLIDALNYLGNSDPEICTVGISSSTVLNNDLKASPVPFEDEVNFEFNLEESTLVHLHIFDATGRKIFTAQHQLNAGEQILNWNAKGLPKGIYFATISTDKEQISTKLIKQ